MQALRNLAVISLSLLEVGVYTQNTVGLITFSPEESFEGYDLLYPDNQSTVFLINSCGEWVQSWSDSTVYRPGDVAYLLPNGNLVKSKRDRRSVVDPIWAGGGGEFIEIWDWNNQLLYSFRQNDAMRRLHHDFTVLPNGNIVAISWEVKTLEETIDQGRNPDRIYNDQVWPDYLLEIDPQKDSIVWEWHTWDHLVQDFDPSKHNFGTIRDNPQLININHVTEDFRSDWLHSNSVDYNSELDQLLISVPHFNEVWIIDHSTSTQEAAGHTGGKSGKGGDILYRWGNPQAYDRGQSRDQLLYYQHDARWLKSNEENNTPDSYRISVFNNRVNDNYSTANIFSLEFSTVTWNYPLISSTWEPKTFDEVIFHPDTFRLQSEAVSSFQLLPNDNRLILSGRFGYAFELNPQNELVWEYLIPFRAGQPVSQGDSLKRSDNFTFRYDRYPADFPGFEGKDLSPKGFLELSPNEEFCLGLTTLNEREEPQLNVYPNPLLDFLQILNHTSASSIRIFDISGKLIKTYDLFPGSNLFDLSSLSHGLYFLSTNDGAVNHRIIKIR